MKTFCVVLVSLLFSGCVTTCKTLSVTKQAADDGKTLITWKCADRTVEAVVDTVPDCMGSCFGGSK